MPTGILTIGPLDYQLNKVPAFSTIQHRGNNLQTTLPIFHMDQLNNYDDGDEPPEEDENQLAAVEKNGLALETPSSASRASNHMELARLQNRQFNPLRKNTCSKSHDNILEGLSELKRKSDSVKSVMSLSTENFTDIFNNKSPGVERQEGQHRKFIEKLNKHKKMSGNECEKKPFITTVKSGEFLMPPPEVAALLGISAQMTTAPDDDHHHQDASRNHMLRFNKSLRRPVVGHNKHNARCQFASPLKANHHHYPNHERQQVSQIQRALPKKLKPIQAPPPPPIMMKPCDCQALSFGNIMYDRRVVRGSTFAMPPLVENEQSHVKRKLLAKRKLSQQQQLRIKSPPPVPGRKHEPVQTELYLEELYEKPDESDIGTQTDYFLQRPTTPLYVSQKIGLDAETQIIPGDLFDFDIEVQPILEILVGGTIEEALIEVLEEEELAALREQQRRFLELRAAEKAEQVRLEEEERRLRCEKNRRLEQQEKALIAQQETEERVAAGVLLTGYIAELLPAVLEGLKISGFLLDEIREDIKEDFTPWLMKQVRREMGTMISSRKLLMDIIREIVESRAAVYKKLGEQYDSYREFTPMQYDCGTADVNEQIGERTFINYRSADLI